MTSVHRLRRGLLGYLIPFAPHAFVSQRQTCYSKLPSHLVFLLILMDTTPTPAVPLASPSLKFSSIICSPDVKHQNLTNNLLNRLHTLYAQ